MVLEWGLVWLWVRCGLCQGAGWGRAGWGGLGWAVGLAGLVGSGTHPISCERSEHGMA